MVAAHNRSAFSIGGPGSRAHACSCQVERRCLVSEGRPARDDDSGGLEACLTFAPNLRKARLTREPARAHEGPTE